MSSKYAWGIKEYSAKNRDKNQFDDDNCLKTPSSDLSFESRDISYISQLWTYSYMLSNDNKWLSSDFVDDSWSKTTIKDVPLLGNDLYLRKQIIIENIYKSISVIIVSNCSYDLYKNSDSIGHSMSKLNSNITIHSHVIPSSSSSSFILGLHLYNYNSYNSFSLYIIPSQQSSLSSINTSPNNHPIRQLSLTTPVSWEYCTIGYAYSYIHKRYMLNNPFFYMSDSEYIECIPIEQIESDRVLETYSVFRSSPLLNVPSSTVSIRLFISDIFVESVYVNELLVIPQYIRTNPVITIDIPAHSIENNQITSIIIVSHYLEPSSFSFNCEISLLSDSYTLEENTVKSQLYMFLQTEFNGASSINSMLLLDNDETTGISFGKSFPDFNIFFQISEDTHYFWYNTICFAGNHSLMSVPKKFSLSGYDEEHSQYIIITEGQNIPWTSLVSTETICVPLNNINRAYSTYEIIFHIDSQNYVETGLTELYFINTNINTITPSYSLIYSNTTIQAYTNIQSPIITPIYGYKNFSMILIDGNFEDYKRLQLNNTTGELSILFASENPFTVLITAYQNNGAKDSVALYFISNLCTETLIFIDAQLTDFIITSYTFTYFFQNYNDETFFVEKYAFHKYYSCYPDITQTICMRYFNYMNEPFYYMQYPVFERKRLPQSRVDGCYELSIMQQPYIRSLIGYNMIEDNPCQHNYDYLPMKDLPIFNEVNQYYKFKIPAAYLQDGEYEPVRTYLKLFWYGNITLYKYCHKIFSATFKRYPTTEKEKLGRDLTNDHEYYSITIEPPTLYDIYIRDGVEEKSFLYDTNDLTDEYVLKLTPDPEVGPQKFFMTSEIMDRLFNERPYPQTGMYSEMSPTSSTSFPVLKEVYEYYNWAGFPFWHHIYIDKNIRPCEYLLEAIDLETGKLVPLYTHYLKGDDKYNDVKVYVEGRYNHFEFSVLPDYETSTPSPTSLSISMDYGDENHPITTFEEYFDTYCKAAINVLKQRYLTIRLCNLKIGDTVLIYPPLPKPLTVTSDGYLMGTVPRSMKSGNYLLSIHRNTTNSIFTSQLEIRVQDLELYAQIHYYITLPYGKNKCNYTLYDDIHTYYSGLYENSLSFVFHSNSSFFYSKTVCESISDYKEGTMYLYITDVQLIYYPFKDDNLTQIFMISVEELKRFGKIPYEYYSDLSYFPTDRLDPPDMSLYYTPKRNTSQSVYSNYTGRMIYYPGYDGLIRLKFAVNDATYYLNGKSFLNTTTIITRKQSFSIALPFSEFYQLSTGKPVSYGDRTFQYYFNYTIEIRSKNRQYYLNALSIYLYPPYYEPQYPEWVTSSPLSPSSPSSITQLSRYPTNAIVLTSSTCEDTIFTFQSSYYDVEAYNQYTIVTPTQCKQYMPTSWELYGEDQIGELHLLHIAHDEYWLESGSERRIFKFNNKTPYPKYIFKYKMCYNYQHNSDCPYLPSNPLHIIQNTLLPHILMAYNATIPGDPDRTTTNNIYPVYYGQYYYTPCTEQNKIGYNEYLSGVYYYSKKSCYYNITPTISIQNLQPSYLQYLSHIDISFTVTDGDLYSITPDLPLGLTMDSSYRITGVPLSIPINNVYVLTVSNRIRMATLTFSINIQIPTCPQDDTWPETKINTYLQHNCDLYYSGLLSRSCDLHKTKNEYTVSWSDIQGKCEYIVCKGLLYVDTTKKECSVCTNGITVYDEGTNKQCNHCSDTQYSDGKQCFEKHYCEQEGEWKPTLANTSAYISCANENTKGYKSRKCLSNGQWDEVDLSECLSISSYEGDSRMFHKVSYQTITANEIDDTIVYKYIRNILKQEGYYLSDLQVSPHYDYVNESSYSLTIQYYYHTNRQYKTHCKNSMSHHFNSLLSTISSIKPDVINPFIKIDADPTNYAEYESVSMCYNPITNEPFPLQTYSPTTSYCPIYKGQKSFYKSYYCSQIGYSMVPVFDRYIFCDSPQISTIDPSAKLLLTIHNITINKIHCQHRLFFIKKLSLLPDKRYFITKFSLDRMQYIYKNDENVLEIEVRYSSPVLNNDMISYMNQLFSNDFYMLYNLIDMTDSPNLYIVIQEHSIVTNDLIGDNSIIINNLEEQRRLRGQ
ncbi:hypothetical protein WA158_003769 [Blastocystis sp. Blastoise]